MRDLERLRHGEPNVGNDFLPSARKFFGAKVVHQVVQHTFAVTESRKGPIHDGAEEFDACFTVCGRVNPFLQHALQRRDLATPGKRQLLGFMLNPKVGGGRGVGRTAPS